MIKNVSEEVSAIDFCPDFSINFSSDTGTELNFAKKTANDKSLHYTAFDCMYNFLLLRMIVFPRRLLDLFDFLSRSWHLVSRRCDECVIAGQNVFLGPTIHLSHLGSFPESHHSSLNHDMYCSFCIRF